MHNIGAAFGIIAACIFYFRSGGKFKWYIFLPLLVFVLLTVLNSCGVFSPEKTVISDIKKTAEDIKTIVTQPEAAGNTGSGRGILWKQTAERIAERPVFGFGPEGFYGSNALNNNATPHNEYLQMAGYLGIPALLLYLSALVMLAIRQWKTIKKLDSYVLVAACGTVAYLVSAFVGNPVFNTAPFLWLLLGLTACGTEGPFIKIVKAEATERLLAKTEKKHLIRIIIAVVAVILVISAVLYMYLERRIEKESETADLQCMRVAESTAILIYRNDVPDEPQYYWYDAEILNLIPASEKMPLPYGMGTARRGGAYEEFKNDLGLNYVYDETADYKNSIIKVTVAKGDDGGIKTAVEWVEYVSSGS